MDHMPTLLEERCSGLPSVVEVLPAMILQMKLVVQHPLFSTLASGGVRASPLPASWTPR